MLSSVLWALPLMRSASLRSSRWVSPSVSSLCVCASDGAESVGHFRFVQTGGGNVEKRAYKMAKQRVSLIDVFLLMIVWACLGVRRGCVSALLPGSSSTAQGCFYLDIFGLVLFVRACVLVLFQSWHLSGLVAAVAVATAELNFRMRELTASLVRSWAPTSAPRPSVRN